MIVEGRKINHTKAKTSKITKYCHHHKHIYNNDPNLKMFTCKKNRTTLLIPSIIFNLPGIPKATLQNRSVDGNNQISLLQLTPLRPTQPNLEEVAPRFVYNNIWIGLFHLQPWKLPKILPRMFQLSSITSSPGCQVTFLHIFGQAIQNAREDAPVKPGGGLVQFNL